MRIIVAAAGGLVVSIIVARSLGPQQMGAYSFAVWLAATVASLSSLGLPDAISKYVAEYKGAGDDAHAASIARKIVAAQVCASAAASVIVGIAWRALGHPDYGLLAFVVAALLPYSLQQTLFALLEGEQRFDLQVVAATAGSVIQITVVLVFAMRHASVMGFLLATLLASASLLVFTIALCWPMLRAGRSSRSERTSKDARRIFSFSLSVYGLWLLTLIVFDKSELFFLRAFRSPAELAYYSIAFALTARLATAGDSVSYVLFPMFVTRYVQGGAEGLRESYRQSIRNVQMLMVPICLWGIFLLPHLILVVYGAQYAQMTVVARILLGTMLFSLTMNVSSSVVYALDRQASFLRYMVVVAVINIVFDLALIPKYGALGAALANGISQATAACGLIILLRRVLPGGFPARISARIYFAALISLMPVACAYTILHGNLLALSVSLVPAFVLYVVLLMSLRVLTQSEVRVFRDSLASRAFRKLAKT